jgi:hypothetical protein
VNPAARAVLVRVLGDLAAHPGSPARDIARRIGEPDTRLVFSLLDGCAYRGGVSRRRDGSGAWLFRREAACVFCGAVYLAAPSRVLVHPQPWCAGLQQLAAGGLVPEHMRRVPLPRRRAGAV